jgi:hypothetical protein
MTGLITVFGRFMLRKTAYYLFRVNAWAVIILLVASTAVNWDELIASYNFSRKDKIINAGRLHAYAVKQSDPLLHQNAEVLKEQWKKQEQLGFVKDPCYSCIDEELKWKKELFQKRIRRRLSCVDPYNLADESINEYFPSRIKVEFKMKRNLVTITVHILAEVYLGVCIIGMLYNGVEEGILAQLDWPPWHLFSVQFLPPFAFHNILFDKGRIRIPYSFHGQMGWIVIALPTCLIAILSAVWAIMWPDDNVISDPEFQSFLAVVWSAIALSTLHSAKIFVH